VEPLKYSLAVITYVDILGFQSLIDSESPGKISRILRLLKEVSQPTQLERETHSSFFKTSPKHPIQFANFSDLTVRYVPLKSVDDTGRLLKWELLTLVDAQRSLVQNGIIIRGGITVGEIRSSRKLIYGPGLIRAYHLEKAATFPCILIDEKIAGIQGHAVEEMLQQDTHGKFLDYLRPRRTTFDSSPEEYLGFLCQHRDLIRDRLMKFQEDEEKRKKYEWLVQYHNRTVREHLDKFLEESKSPQDDIHSFMI